MTGYEEAVAWLKTNSRKWRIEHVETRLRAGSVAGEPTEQWVEVTLSYQAPFHSVSFLLGEGSSILEATQRAVGGLR